jgi:hypothetical protein
MTQGPDMIDPGFPNVHARLRVQQRQPGIPDRELELEIWLAGTRFRVRDAGGRAAYEIVGDVTAPRGLGMPVREVEDMMDRASAAYAGPATELYGDLATGEGWVYPPAGERWPKPARELAPAAAQILAGDQATGLEIVGPEPRLGRHATAYRGQVAVSADGVPRHNEVRRVIAAPYLLYEAAHDAEADEVSYRRELVALDEGGASDTDLTPPVRAAP